MTQREGIAVSMLDTLSKPTPTEEIRQRQGPGGKMLDYIDARFVMDRLDEIGPENWQDQYVDRTDGSVRCGIGILIDGEWVWKWDVGDPSDIEANKGAYSEAFKRAGVKWGIARDLYGHAPSAARRPTTPAAASASSASAAPPSVGTAGRAPVRPAASTVPPEPDWIANDFGEPAGHTHISEIPPMCPAHRWAMKPGKKGGWYCSGKGVEGFAIDAKGYCGERVA